MNAFTGSSETSASTTAATNKPKKDEKEELERKNEIRLKTFHYTKLLFSLSMFHSVVNEFI